MLDVPASSNQAERGRLDLVTIDDTLTIQSANHFAADDRTDQVRGRLDATLIGARVAPASAHIGLVPVVTATRTANRWSRAWATARSLTGSPPARPTSPS